MTSGGFDPSMLDNKDRAELAAIAESLGQKPPARAKKADIIGLIQELVSGAGPATPEPAVAPGAGGAPDQASLSFAEGAGPSAEAAPREAPASNGDGAASNGRGEPEGSDSASTDSQRSDADGATGSDDGKAGKAGKTGQAATASGGAGTVDVDADEAGPGGSGEGGSGEGGTEAGQGDEDGADTGNRRRRRRGRDRRADGEDQGTAQAEPFEVSGIVDLREEGYGFLRVAGWLPHRDDCYISIKQTRQFGLRTGDRMKAKARPATRNEKNPAVLQVDEVNGHQAHNQPVRPHFDDLTPVFPTERLTLELAEDSDPTVRAIDLLAPIGKGQRALVAAPPRAGTSSLLKHVIRSVEVNHPDAELLVLLIDERPEDVTDIAQWVLRGTVASSTFDRPPAEHVLVAELALEWAKRLVEQGRDVVVVVDNLTRLARAHNLTAPEGGRVLAEMLDTTSLHPPKKLLGAARNIEQGGSLTVVAAVAADTDSLLDELIFDELTGTANAEITLDRHLAERDVFPAIDLERTGTRHLEELVGRAEATQRTALRGELLAAIAESGSLAAGVEALVAKIAANPTNGAVLGRKA